MNKRTNKLKENPFLSLYNLQQARDDVSRDVLKALNKLKKEKENTNNK